MAYTQRPCVCGGTDFLVLPDMQLHHGASTVASHLTGVRTIAAGPQ